MFKSFSTGKFVRHEATLYISSRSSVLIVEYSLQQKRKWIVVSVFRPHLHIGSTASLKPCLNLCSFKWLKFNLRLVISVETFGAMYCKIGVLFGSDKTEDYFSKFMY